MEKSAVLDIIERDVAKLTPGFVRYAKLAMLELERNDLSSFVLLRNDELREWWQAEVDRVIKRSNRASEAIKKYELKMEAWNKLDPDERKVLGLRKPTKPKEN